MKEQNDGFSLVELIVSMAILMIAGAALIGFFSYCMGQYKRTNEEVDLQYASQVFDNRFKNHLMQAQSVYLTDDGQILYLQMDDGLEKFYVDPAKGQVVYQKYVLSQDTWQAEGDAVCFASYVATWNLVCYDTKGQEITGEDPVQAKKMTFSYQMKTAEKTYEAKETVTFRGKILYQRPDGI